MQHKIEYLLLGSFLLLLLTGVHLFFMQQPLAAPDTIKNIEYANVNGKPLLLDLYIPNQNKNPLPLIIYIHGGGWMEGSKESCPAREITEQGYTIACVDYRLSKEAKFPAQIHDIKAAIRWLRANANQYNINPDKFGIFGDSAGGHLAALAGTSGDAPELEGNVGIRGYSSRVQAVVDWFGPVDPIAVENITNKDEEYYEYYSAATKLFGGPIKENHDKAKQANPITYISADDPPFLVIHGVDDRIVPVEQSKTLYSALKNAEVDAELIISNAGHGFKMSKESIEFNKTMEFFDRKLKN